MSAGVVVLAVALFWWGSRLPNQIRLIEEAAEPAGWQSPKAY
jgi:hypothetical protein